MRVLLFILISASAVFAQNFQHIPANPQKIVDFKQQFVFSEKEPVVRYQFFDDDKKLMVMGRQTVRVWDTKSGKLLSEIAHEAGKDKHFDFGSQFSPDGTKLVVTDPFRWKFGKEKIQLGANVYDLNTGKFSAELKNDRHSIRSAFWSANSKTLVTLDQTVFSSDDKETEACFWDGDTLQKRVCLILPGKLEWNYLSKDGRKFIATLDPDWPVPASDRIFMVDTASGTVLKNIEGRNRIWSTPTPISPSGKVMVNSLYYSVEFWDIDEKISKNI